LTSKNEKKDLEKIFQAMDVDGNGDIDKEELLQGYEKHFGIEISPAQVDEMFKAVDLDGNGTIDFTEFVMATMNEKELITPERLRAAFRMFDSDNSGSISRDEIKKILGFSSEENNELLDELINEIDENGDGEI
jgi:calcium-dependent protein kinase